MCCLSPDFSLSMLISVIHFGSQRWSPSRFQRMDHVLEGHVSLIEVNLKGNTSFLSNCECLAGSKVDTVPRYQYTRSLMPQEHALSPEAAGCKSQRTRKHCDAVQCTCLWTIEKSSKEELFLCKVSFETWTQNTWQRAGTILTYNLLGPPSIARRRTNKNHRVKLGGSWLPRCG